MFDPDVAAAFLNEHANGSVHRCAEFVRNAIKAGGVTLVLRASAKDYGSSLEAAGFRAMDNNVKQINCGDVAIIQPIAGHPHGHMAMFNGTQWVSDFKQQHGLYPNTAYRSLKPPFTIYRYQLLWAAPPSETPTFFALS